MESRARRRLALISTHLNPPAEASSPPNLLASACENNIEKGHNNDCVFCKIIHGQSPALKIYEDDECLCILDTYPLCHGHSLIIPKCHFPSLDATPPSIIGAMCAKVPLISNAVMKATGCDSFNLLVNNGASAGQVIYHSIRRRPMKLDQEASQLANCIRENLSSVNNNDDSKGQASDLIEN